MPFVFTPSFLTMPATQQLDGDKWVLRAPFKYVRKNGEQIFVPPGGLGDFESICRNPFWTTDYGSIPMLFQNLIKKDGINAAAFVTHDWIFEVQDRPLDDANNLLLEMLVELKDDWATEHAIYIGVDLGGEKYWKQHTDEQIALAQAYHKAFMEELPTRWPELVAVS